MMEQAGFIVSVDLGTSSIVGLLGRRNEQGVISILASESIPADSCVKHGIVYNIDEAAGKVRKLVNLLENKVGKKIGKVYVSISGMSLHSMEHRESKSLMDETSVTFSMLDQLEQQARSTKPALLANYSAVAPEIFLDGSFEEDPIGKLASSIEARYQLIVGRPNIKSNLIRSITDKNQVGIAGYIIGPVATGAILLDEEDKNAGCALVDFGGGTTIVSIYKGGLLRFLSVIPFGGRTITKDIQSLGLTYDVAENSKIRYGRVGKDKNKDAAVKKTTSESGVDVKELNKVIHLRQDEIVLNVLNQIKESGYGDELTAGIVVTGGASQLLGLADYLAEKSKLSVKVGAIKRLYINNATDILQNPSFSQALGLMLFANENCEKREEPKVENERPQPTTHHQYQERPERVAEQPRPKTVEPEVEEEIENVEEPQEEPRSKKEKENKKQKTLFDFFGKIQNFGGTMFKDEE